MRALDSNIAAALVAIALLGAASGCGDRSSDDPAPAPTGPLAEALAEIGGGGASGSLGVGWADPRLARRSGVGPAAIADAVGPNAGTVIEARRRLRREFGIDPLAARRLISVGGSYAFGLRLDGLDGARLARALVAAGGRERARGGIDLVDIGDYAVVPEPLLRLGINGLGASDAFGERLTVLAISERARGTLLGGGDRLLDQPAYRAAADCLGDVVAVRMIPDKLLLSTEQGVDLLAIGVDAGREVLCVVGGDAERAGDVAAGLETSLDPGARDPVTGVPIGEAVDTAEIANRPYEGVEVVRAELTLADGRAPGLLFGTVASGSLVRLINGG